MWYISKPEPAEEEGNEGNARAECEKGIADMRKETEDAKAKEAKKAQLEADKYVKNFDKIKKSHS